MQFGARIKAERTAKGWTQKELALKAGLPAQGGQQAIQGLESRDSARSQFAPALCKALGLSMEWALNGNGPKYEMDRKQARHQRLEIVAKPAPEPAGDLENISALTRWLRAMANAASAGSSGESKIRLHFIGGSPMLIDASVHSVDQDAVYSFQLNGVPYVRKIERRPDKSLWVIFPGSSTPTYRVEPGDDLNVDGRVVLTIEAKPPV